MSRTLWLTTSASDYGLARARTAGRNSIDRLNRSSSFHRDGLRFTVVERLACGLAHIFGGANLWTPFAAGNARDPERRN